MREEFKAARATCLRRKGRFYKQHVESEMELEKTYSLLSEKYKSSSLRRVNLQILNLLYIISIRLNIRIMWNVISYIE